MTTNNIPTATSSPATPTTLDFAPLTLEDIPLINGMLQGSYSRTCDYSVGGIMMWADYFNYEFCVADDTLFIKGLTENNRSETAFMLPVGAMSTPEAVACIIEYCRQNGIKPVFSAVPEDRMDILLDALTEAEVEPLDDWADYIYNIRAHASFSGKQLSKKRNHFNQFVNANPGWIFETLTQNQIEEVKDFLSDLENEKTMSDIARYEYDQCRHVLDKYNLFPFEGAVLRRHDGQIVAFTVGEVVGDTLFVHIEKMDHSVEGSGAAVCKLFADYMLMRHPGLRYINREEDCGDLGLRHAKEQYHPIAILNKYNVRGLSIV